MCSRTIRPSRIFLSLFLIFTLHCSPSFAPQSFPPVRFSAEPYLSDESKTLTAEQQGEISRLITAHNQEGPGRIFVVILKSLPVNRTLEESAYSLINQESPASHERPDRILILISMREHGIRIETSRDVWHLIPNEYCDSIIKEQMAPAFRKSDFYSGIRAAVEALSKKLKA